MAFVLLATLLGAGAFVSGLTYILFWYEAANPPHPSHRATCEGTPGLARCVALGFLSSVSSQLMVYLTYPFGFAKRLWKPAPSPSCSRPPVLLVHGLYHNASAWHLYKWWLRRRGYEKVFAWSYNTVKNDFWQLADQLKGVVREAAGLCGGEPVILVGHSLGGLLTRAAIADPQTAKLVRAAVILGAPNKGSKLSALALGRLGRSLKYGGPLARKLNAMPAPRDLPKLNVYSPLDNMVLPTSSLEIGQDGWMEEQTAPISHVSMLYHIPTIRMVLDFLDEAAPACEGRAAGEDARPGFGPAKA